MSFADRNTHKLYEWLKRLAGDGSGRVSLGHLSASGPGVPLGQWAVRQEDSDETLRQLAGAIVQAAADDTDGQTGGMPQQYVTLFYAEDAPDRAASRLPLRLAAPEQFAPEGSALATEPPTDKGLLSQAIRHNEFLVRTSFGAMGAACANLERQNHMMSEQIMRQTEQIFDMQRERQELLDRDSERLLKIEQFEADRDHRDRLTSEVLSAGKGFMAMLANGGKPLMLPVSTGAGAAGPAPRAPSPTNGSRAADDGVDAEDEGASASAAPQSVPAAAVLALSQLQDFFRSLTPEQTQQIGALLSPAQQGSLLTLYQLFAGLDDEEKATMGMGT